MGGFRALRERLPDGMEFAALLIGNAAFVILFLFLLRYDNMDRRLLADWQLFFLALGGSALFFLCYWKWAGKEVQNDRKALWILLGIHFALFLVQLFVIDKNYFYSGWDVGKFRYYVADMNRGIPFQETEGALEYSIYRNNLFLFYCAYLMQKAGAFLGLWEPYVLCVCGSALSVNLACLLGQRVLSRLTRNPFILGLYTFVGSVYVILSPWILIPYSDTYGMLFAMLGIWGLVCLERPRRKWPVTIFAAVIGYLVKPTCIFPLFAAVIFFGIRYLLHWKEKKKILGLMAAVTILAWLVQAGILFWIQQDLDFEPEKGMGIPLIHYVMMGINLESWGSYNYEDFLFTSGIEDRQERIEAVKERLLQRAGSYSLQDWKQLIKNKTLNNFNDGTFAWAWEGMFFEAMLGEEGFFADLFNQTLVLPGTQEGSGVYFAHSRTVAQGIWLWILLGICFSACDLRGFRRERACMFTVLCGLMVFVMLFEGRARYLFLYAPVFLILSLSGYEALYRRLLSGLRGGRTALRNAEKGSSAGKDSLAEKIQDGQGEA